MAAHTFRMYDLRLFLFIVVYAHFSFTCCSWQIDIIVMLVLWIRLISSFMIYYELLPQLLTILVCSVVRDIRSLVFCVVCCPPLFVVFCPFSFGHCIVCPSNSVSDYPVGRRSNSTLLFRPMKSLIWLLHHFEFDL